MKSLLLFMLLHAVGDPDAGGTGNAIAEARSDAGTSLYDPRDPSTWRLEAVLKPESREKEALIHALTQQGGEGAPLTRAEAEQILSDARAQRIYGDKTISVVAPTQPAQHRQEHLDLTKILLTPHRLAAGRRFLSEHSDMLARAQKEMGVDPSVIVSILMWESKLGTITGDWLAFNVFTSQAFFIDQANALALANSQSKEPVDQERQRSRVERIRKRAYRNLIALLRHCKERGINPLDLKGSWAGALGFPQFMPASLRWAKDGNGDNVVDLNDFDDASFSIANYLSTHGYSKDRRRAVWSYNHEDAYVTGVLAYADALANPN